MKQLSYKTIITLVVIAAALFSGCKKDVEPVPEPIVIPPANEVNLFIWNGLHDYYLWNSQVANLSAPKFSNKDTLNLFLNKYTDKQALFTSLLYKYKDVDRWSFLVEDYKTIENWIAGISKTMGFDFMLGRIGSSDNLFGFVRYVYKNSPAEKAGMKRGDIFLKVNDQQLTVSNYQDLLLKTETYKLGFATITNSTISPSSRTVTMTAVELQENPIHKDTIFVYNNQKVGYLVYNGFNADFDIPLNNVIKKFKDANIDQMVLDLRYNGGGSVQSSIYLASMLYGTDQSKIFAKAQYNNGLQSAYVSEYGAASLNDYFANTISATAATSTKPATPATPIVSLNLQKIYIIVSDNTASASELLINGLKPYMKVTIVGINTEGKYTGSATIKDWDQQGNVNPNHTYAMQPIIVKYANSAGETDFINGLTPNINAEEDFTNLLPFGDPNETLLATVLADMKGISITGKVLKSARIGLEKVAQSRDFKPFANEMYINPRPLKTQN